MEPTMSEIAYDEVPDSFRVPYVWLDGSLRPAAEASVPLMTLTLHYGLGAFEGIRAYQGDSGPAIFRLREHIERLDRSCRLVGMAMPYSVEQVSNACLETMAANNLGEGYLRPLAFVDDGKRGLAARKNRIRVAVVVWPWGAYLGDEGIANGIRATVASWERMNPRSFVPKGKICGQYVNSILAKREAVHAGFDEAILLDSEGRVAEASGENIFLVEGNRLITPSKAAPILEGITRDSVITLARDLGMQIEETQFGRERMFLADEVFLTGTAAEVTPVREIDGRKIGSGSRGPKTAMLQQAYMDAVRGRSPAYRGWLSTYTLAG